MGFGSRSQAWRCIQQRSKRRCSASLGGYRKRTDVGMRPSRPPSWATGGASTSRGCWRAIPKPFVKVCAISRRQRMGRLGASAKKGGRPPRVVAQPTLEANLGALLQEFTAGDPMREGVLWTNLSLRELSSRLVALGTPRTLRRLRRKLKVGRRTARKKKTMGHHPDRNAQFENIVRLRRAYEASGDAVISIDTKKKELLGNFHRGGTPFPAEPVETFDHDFGSASQGKLIPHGIYDMVNHQAHIHLNTSHDTSELCCDSVALWWEQAGRTAHPRAKRLLVLGDGGGSNSATQYLCKENLQGLA